MASLYQIRDDGSAAECWEIGKRPLVVGRGDQSEARVLDHALSRQHFAISRDGDGYMVEDLNSNNGTWVDGRRIRVAWLKAGDCIVAGQTVFIFQLVQGSSLDGDCDLALDTRMSSQDERFVPTPAAWEWPESWLVRERVA